MDKDNLDAYFKKCIGELTHEEKLLYQVIKSKMPRGQAIKLIENSKLELSKKQQILSILKLKEDRIQKLDLSSKVSMLANSLELEADKGKRFRKNVELTKAAKNIRSTSVFFSALFDAVVAIRVGNLAKAKLAIVDGISKSPYRMIFTFDSYKVGSGVEFKQFRSNIFKVINFITSNLHHDMLSKLLVSHVSIIDKSPEAQELISNLGASWSLVDVRGLSHSRIYDRSFLLIWLELLENRALHKEIQDYLNKQLTEKVILNLGIDSLSLIDRYQVSDQNLKTMSLVIKEAFNSSNLFDQFVVIRSINNPAFKDLMKSVPKKYQGATFQVYQKYFRGLLSRGNSIDFSVFQLIKLGDIKMELIWWLI